MPITYKPIDCNLYDFFEEAATVKKLSHFLISEEGMIDIHVTGKIVNLYTKDGEEFMSLDTGLIVRLDHVKSINDVSLTSLRKEQQN